ncbi:MAG: putative manganese-dependent inorganic diphosphatase [Sphaerochaeta sp.]|nr:putative manganese-dependent inorganic diphosphatase [Spirochaetales bacterium]
MADIYVTGHRNPDMDSICAAYSYAYLKNKVDLNNTYHAIRIGNLNEATRAQFERLGVSAPPFLRDIRTKVESVVSTSDFTVDISDPIFSLVSFYGSESLSAVIPVMENGTFRSLVSIDDVSGFILQENSTKRPIYHFVVDNIPKVLEGSFLKRAGDDIFDAPIMIGASRYVSFCRQMAALGDVKPILVVGDRENHIKKAIEMQIPAIILTGIADEITSVVDWDSYQGTVFVSSFDTAETFRLLRLTVPVGMLAGKKSLSVEVDRLFDEARDILTDNNLRSLPVFDEGVFKGFVTRSSFLNKPRSKLIMVDHNESEQSIEGIEEAEVVEIIDHHRLGADRTREPIFIYCEPLGSTCTIVYKLFVQHGVEIPKTLARVMLSGILSDTIILKSPTTTFEDYTAVQDLLVLGQVSDMRHFGETMFSGGAALVKADPRRMLEGDFKRYKEVGVAFGIGQAEVTTLSDVDDYAQIYLDELENLRKAYMLDWTMFLITDVVRESSILLMTSMPIAERKISYKKEGEGRYLAQGVLSRKKQLLPEILRVLEE